MTTSTERSSYTVDRAGKGFYLAVVVLLALIVFGIFAYSRQFIFGDVVTGLRDIGTMGGAAWGLYIAIDVYLAGVAFAGITLVALARLFNLEQLRPLFRIAEMLTIIALMLAGMIVVADLGQPGRGLVYLFQYARPMSAFFGTFTLVISGTLFATLVYFYLDSRRDAALCAQRPGRWQWVYRLWAAGYRDTEAERERHHRTTWWLALALLPLLIIGISIEGLLFGVQVGRPGWFSALQAPGFIVMAGASGIGFIIVIAAILRSMSKLRKQLPLHIFSWLGNLLWVLIGCYLYFTVIEILTASYAAPQAESMLVMEMLTGDYAGLFWLSMGLLLVSFGMLFGQFLLHRFSLPLTVVAGAMVGLAAIGKRFLIVVPSQTHGMLLPYAQGNYSPTWVEYAVVLGLFAMGTLAYMLFIRVFPIMEIEEGGGG